MIEVISPELTWTGCPVCGSDPTVLSVNPNGTLMQCACGWFGWFADCWTVDKEQLSF